MKRKKNWKKQLNKTLSKNSHLLIAAVLVVALAGMMFYKQPAQAASERGKTAAAVLGGGGTGALIAGVAGSAKWAPLGFGAGAVGALLIKRAIRKGRERKAEMQNQQVPYHESRRTRRQRERAKYRRTIDQDYRDNR